MFWQSPNNNRHYDSTDSESSTDLGSTLWNRPKQSTTTKHKRPSRAASHSALQSSWIPQWFAPAPPSPPPKRSHHQNRHRKTPKSNVRSCRPKSKHGWGIVSFNFFSFFPPGNKCVIKKKLESISNFFESFSSLYLMNQKYADVFVGIAYFVSC